MRSANSVRFSQWLHTAAGWRVAFAALGAAFWRRVRLLELGFGHGLATMLGIARSMSLGQNMLNNDIIGDRTNLN